MVAVDVGGTTIKGAVVDRCGRFESECLRSTPTPTPASGGSDAVIAELQAVVAELVATAGGDVGAVGLVVPGVVDAIRGRAELSANLGFRGVPLRDLVAAATRLPVVLEHDVRAAGVAERTVGSTVGVQDFLLAVIGTGIAGVVQASGHHVTGATGLAGELGHIPVWPGGEHCPCGQRGCLERYASAAAVARRYAQAGGEVGLSAAEIAERAGSGDATAGRVWQEAVEALAIALATCTMLLDPAMIVLAGGLSNAGHALLEPVRQALVGLVRWREPPPVELSRLGGRAGVVGAALFAWQAAGEQDFGSWRL